MRPLRRLRRRVTRSDAFVGALAGVTRAFILLYSKTLRVTLDSHPEHDALDPSKVLYGFWHGRQFLLVPAFRGSGIAIMTNLSWAGEIQSRVLTGLGYVVVRGSSKRRPARALAAMKAAIERGHPAAFALDGPSGPARRSKPGILFLAAKIGYPVVPVGTSASGVWHIPGTWCRYLLPIPFTRCVVRLGRPIIVTGKSVGTDDLDAAVELVTAEADRAAGRRGVAAGRRGRDRSYDARDADGEPDARSTDGPPRGTSTDTRAVRLDGGKDRAMSDEVKRTDDEWRKILTPEQYRVTRETGTEPPFTGEYDDFKGEGLYKCVCCGSPLFRSTEKYDSGSGWPSFWAPVSEDSITTENDDFGGMRRTEIKCGRCGAHLGHVFEDGPEPSGLRYCTNSLSLDFEEKDGRKDEGEG